MPFARHSRRSLHTRPRLLSGTRRSGRAGARSRLLKRRDWRYPIEPCCCSPALSTLSETHRIWLGTAPRRATDRHRTSSGLRIKPGVLPVRSTRKSSSAWVVPSTRLRLWLELCRALFGECATESRLPCTATRTSASSLIGTTARSAADPGVWTAAPMSGSWEAILKGLSSTQGRCLSACLSSVAAAQIARSASHFFKPETRARLPR
jgi:hypothetical protein